MQKMWAQSVSQEDPWRRKWKPTPVFLSGESHGQKRLEGYSPWGHKRVGHDLRTKIAIVKQLLFSKKEEVKRRESDSMISQNSKLGQILKSMYFSVAKMIVPVLSWMSRNCCGDCLVQYMVRVEVGNHKGSTRSVRLFFL